MSLVGTDEWNQVLKNLKDELDTNYNALKSGHINSGNYITNKNLRKLTLGDKLLHIVNSKVCEKVDLHKMPVTGDNKTIYDILNEYKTEKKKLQDKKDSGATLTVKENKILEMYIEAVEKIGKFITDYETNQNKCGENSIGISGIRDYVEKVKNDLKDFTTKVYVPSEDAIKKAKDFILPSWRVECKDIDKYYIPTLDKLNKYQDDIYFLLNHKRVKITNESKQNTGKKLKEVQDLIIKLEQNKNSIQSNQCKPVQGIGYMTEEDVKLITLQDEIKVLTEEKTCEKTDLLKSLLDVDFTVGKAKEKVEGNISQLKGLITHGIATDSEKKLLQTYKKALNDFSKYVGDFDAEQNKCSYNSITIPEIRVYIYINYTTEVR